MNTQDNPFPEHQGLIVEQRLLPEQGMLAELQGPLPDQRGFTTADILWALGIWSVILCLSPVIVFYVLMVA